MARCLRNTPETRDRLQGSNPSFYALPREAIRRLLPILVVSAAACGDSPTQTPSGPALEIIQGSVSGVVGDAPEIQPAVRVRNAQGRPEEGVEVIWTFGSQPNVRTHTTTSRDGGVAVAAGVLDVIAGPQVVTASLASGPGVTIPALAVPGPVVRFAVPERVMAEVDATSASGFSFHDRYDNPVPMSRARWTVSSADVATVDSAGAVTGTAPGITTLLVEVDDSAATVPLEVRPLLRLVSIDGGFDHACGVSADGNAFCWGDNDDGELGLGHADPVDGAGRVVGGIQFATVSAGDDASCGVSLNGTGYCWGGGPFLLGDSSDAERLEPAPIALSGPLLDLNVSLPGTLCAVRTTGDAYCWGSNSNGRAVWNAFDFVYRPSRVPIAGDVRQVTSAGLSSCARLASGEAWCWGHGSAVGREASGRNPPTPIAGDHRFQMIASGTSSTCGLDAQGTVWCWGSPESLLEAVGATVNYPEPSPIGGITLRGFGLGNEIFCGITLSDELHCSSRDVFLRTIDLPESPAADVDVLSWHTFACAIAVSGAPYCWSPPGRTAFPEQPTRVYAAMPAEGGS